MRQTKLLARHSLIFTALLTVLLSCSAPHEMSFATDQQAQSAFSGKMHKVFIATTRAPVEGAAKYGGTAAKHLSYNEYDISVPPNHKVGKLEFTRKNPNPEKYFTTHRDTHHTQASFIKGINTALREVPTRDNEIVLFVHGYNVTYARGAYRFAQLAHDTDFPSLAMAYSWPSLGSFWGYVHDRDATMVARDSLEELITQIESSDVENIILVGHSVGAHLTMETLRQISIRRNGLKNSKIGEIILFSPDIDPDVFAAQVRQIGPLPDDFFVFISNRDRALSLSTFLSQGAGRLGARADYSQFTPLGIKVIDTTKVDGGDFLRHFTAGTTPEMTLLLRQLNNFDQVKGFAAVNEKGELIVAK